MAEAGWPPLAIAVAPTGARRSKADHPGLPITPAEIAREARACRDAGAAMLHLHVRDGDGRHTLDPDAYRAAMAAVRADLGEALVIQVTTESVGRYAPAGQMAAVRALAPEAASIAVRELIPDSGHEASAAAFLRWCAEAGVAVQYIVYDVADLEHLRALTARGVIPQRRPFVLYVLGRYARGQQASPRQLLPFLAAGDDPGGPWMLCAFGVREAACAAAAAALGGHVRVGFENNLHLPDGRRAPDNAALVAAAAETARAIGRPLADARWLRESLAESRNVP